MRVERSVWRFTAGTFTYDGGHFYVWLDTCQVQRMLDLVPTGIHERCPVILGSPRDVKLVLDRYN